MIIKHSLSVMSVKISWHSMFMTREVEAIPNETLS